MSEELWFPEFGLRKNPFALSDKRTELNRGEDYTPVETDATRLVGRLVNSGGRTIISGPKGCGKTTTAHFMREMNDKSIVAVVGPASLKELISMILSRGLADLQQGFAELSTRVGKEIKLDGIAGKVVGELDKKYSGILRDWFDQKPQYSRKKAEGLNAPIFMCEFSKCPMKHRCEFPQFKSKLDITFMAVANYLNDVVSLRDINCPLMQWVTVRLFEPFEHWSDNHLERIQPHRCFVLDVPDEAGNNISARYFREFIRELDEVSGLPFVILATSQQFYVLWRSDFFARWMRKKFPSMMNEELTEMCEDRLESDRLEDPQIKFQNPFTSDGFKRVFSASAWNPRNVISNVGLVLQRMLEDGVKEPVGEDYVEAALKDEGFGIYVHTDDALDVVLKELRNAGRVRVLVREMVPLMEKQGVKISAIALGKKLSARGFERFNAGGKGGSEYRIQ
jgi:hypothetical protein